jgi:outer membrane lipoprotein LolB
MHTGRRLALWLTLLLLAGCAGMAPREPTSPDWQAHRAQLESLQQWTATGKIALRTSSASESASLVWRQDHQSTQLHLSGPLGVNATTLESDGQLLHIHRGDEHQTLDISTPEAVFENTGWDLPLPALAHWLKGLPAPDPDVERLGFDKQTGLLRYVRQDGWEVNYEQYAQFQGVTLPVRLQIERGETRVKVIVARWDTASH